MKKRLLGIFGVLLALLSITLICYPFISNYFMELNQASEIIEYEGNTENTDKEKLELEWKRADEYNKSFSTEIILRDPFDPNFLSVENAEYESLLNLNGDMIMGVVDIPSVNIHLPIYHGTDKYALEHGAGHLVNTSLPIGGRSTHSVITGHTGLPVAKLFTDIHLMNKGDKFYIKVLGKTLAYEVDEINVVKPSKTDKLRVVDGKDYVTLVTCTPYGVNSHRLFVRGKRVPYSEKELEKAKAATINSDSMWMKEYKKALFASAVLLMFIVAAFIIVRFAYKRCRGKKTNRVQGE